MTRPSPLLRAAILSVLPQGWTTARDIARAVELWSWQAVRTELWAMSKDGLIAKRIEQIHAGKIVGFYRRAEAV